MPYLHIKIHNKIAVQVESAKSARIIRCRYHPAVLRERRNIVSNGSKSSICDIGVNNTIRRRGNLRRGTRKRSNIFGTGKDQERKKRKKEQGFFHLNKYTYKL